MTLPQKAGEKLMGITCSYCHGHMCVHVSSHIHVLGFTQQKKKKVISETGEEPQWLNVRVLQAWGSKFESYIPVKASHR